MQVEEWHGPSRAAHLEELLCERLHARPPALALQQPRSFQHGRLHIGLGQAVQQALDALCQPL